MDHNKEYHDPDYPEPAPCVKEEPSTLSVEEKVGKIKSIISREFSNELQARENEVMLIDQRMSTSRRLLHRLRYAIVSRYYSDQKLHLSNGQIQDEIAAQRDPTTRNEVASLLSGQRQLHPSVRKLLGKRSVDIDEIFRTRGPRNKTKKDYVAMLQKRNYTISADSTKTLRPGAEPAPEPCSSVPKKIPRHMEPKLNHVLTLIEPTRNKIKHRYRIIIGNTSKYVPAASRLDRSTHKWLLYIRGPPPPTAANQSETPDFAELTKVVTAVTVTLHHSYAPHHIVHLDKPPYHISRRGWGEFPAKIELHFTLPDMNRPAAVTHTIKLDRNYTGLQVLGSETVVDVWLYSTQDMLPYEFKEEDTQSQTHTQNNEQTDIHTDILSEIKTENNPDDNWMDFFTKAPTELDVDGMIIKPTKKEVTEPPIDESIQEETNNLEPIPNIKTEIEEVHHEIIQEVEEKHETITEIKQEPYQIENQETQEDTILQVPTEIYNQPTSVKKRIVKYIDPTTGKIYYLEMDRELDLTKVQEIIINNTTAKISPNKSNGLKNVRKKKTGGISLLKPEVKNLLKENNRTDKLKPILTHIENDHCYLSAPKVLPVQVKTEQVAANIEVCEIKKEADLYSSLCSAVCRLTSIRSAVNYLVKHIPLITEEARDPDYLKHFPFAVENSERYWKLDFAKRRNIEWSRAKLINRILSEHFRHPDTIWRTKQILLYVRMHGHYPVRIELQPAQLDPTEWSAWGGAPARDSDSRAGDLKDINTLSVFDMQLDRSLPDTCEVSDDEEVDIVSVLPPARGGACSPAAPPALRALPVAREQDALRYLFVERHCHLIGLQLANESVGSGYAYSAVHAVLVSAMKSFAEELIRTALAHRRKHEQPQDKISVWTGSPSARSPVSVSDIYSAAQSSRLRFLTAGDIATTNKHTYAI